MRSCKHFSTHSLHTLLSHFLFECSRQSSHSLCPVKNLSSDRFQSSFSHRRVFSGVGGRNEIKGRSEYKGIKINCFMAKMLFVFSYMVVCVAEQRNDTYHRRLIVYMMNQLRAVNGRHSKKYCNKIAEMVDSMCTHTYLEMDLWHCIKL